ncbi:hypothetical protein P8452_28611 [Trifolium repens]|nr:hypothetical protein P8452_28611 [Trifolium repens]
MHLGLDKTGPNRLKPYGPNRKTQTGRFQSGPRVEESLSVVIYGLNRAGPPLPLLFLSTFEQEASKRSIGLKYWIWVESGS